MKHSPRFPFATIALTFTLASEAHADEAPDRAESSVARAASDARSNFETRPTAVLGEFNWTGSPVGVLGAEVEHSPVPWLAVTGGGGVGLSGAQVAVGLRGRLVLTRRFAIGGGAGVSYGAYRSSASKAPDEGAPDAIVPGGEAARIFWANPEVGIETRFDSGFTMRYALGASFDVLCVSGACRTSRPPEGVLPFVVGAFGYAF